MDERIHAARQVAQKILRPTAKQLEHGLELHANSLVFESHGFAPWAPVDGDAVRAAAETGASDAELREMAEIETLLAEARLLTCIGQSRNGAIPSVRSANSAGDMGRNDVKTMVIRKTAG